MPMRDAFLWRWPARLVAMAGALVLLGIGNPAWAGCAATSGTASLGAASSFAVAGEPQGASANTGFSCSGSGILTLLATNRVTATVQGATNSNGSQLRLHDPSTGDHIPYILCRDSGCSQSYAVGSQVIWSSTTLLGLLNLFNGPGGTLPLYVRTTPGVHVAAGTYTSRVTLSWSWNICSVGGSALGVEVCLLRDTGTDTSVVDISLVVSRDCAITAPAVNFGTAALVSSFDPVTQSLTIRCSKDAAYTVGISNGLQPLNGKRRMTNGTHFIAYDVFFPATSGARWGNSGVERRGSGQATTNAGLYTGVAGQTFTYRAEVEPGQVTPPGGTFTDTLVIDVAF